jgi:hypothetical protein
MQCHGGVETQRQRWWGRRRSRRMRSGAELIRAISSWRKSVFVVVRLHELESVTLSCLLLPILGFKSTVYVGHVPLSGRGRVRPGARLRHAVYRTPDCGRSTGPCCSKPLPASDVTRGVWRRGFGWEFNNGE